MAKNLTKAEDGEPTEATRLHNTGERKEIIQKAAKEIRTLQSQADTHRTAIKGLNKSVGDVFRKVKSDIGIKRKDLEAVMALLDLEEDDLNETLDGIRECYEALKPGEQLDWLTAAEKKAAAEAPATLQ